MWCALAFNQSNLVTQKKLLCLQQYLACSPPGTTSPKAGRIKAAGIYGTRVTKSYRCTPKRLAAQDYPHQLTTPSFTRPGQRMVSRGTEQRHTHAVEPERNLNSRT